ncbi:MAG: flagellar biosynthesis protein FlhA [Pseudomonadota bacterium]|jgi:flagellar biosynthesis component FlhA
MFKSRELVIPLGLLLVVGCMIIPLPGAVLDILLCSNLLFALLLVIGALHIRDPLKMATLPSLLLMATLWRLSLNLATTRAVLSSGHAGQAVEAFGAIVIQGSVVVGFVLFLLISLIQFIVVAKGAERVAEVSARFTLDALPGKQMAIDAEIRSGALDPESARRKRADIQMESRFYGALDGAMKFVKGDAIAGLVIAAVNIVGGLAVGILVHQLDIEVALRRYTVLTIGDGLLSQIPSLLNSVAAGLVVTRVQVDESSTLASDLLGQLGQFKMARTFVAVAAFILGCLPGMPHLILISVSVLLVLSLFLPEPRKEIEAGAVIAPFEPSLAQSIQIEINQEWVSLIPPLSEVSKAMEELRQYAFISWGLVLQRPGIGLWQKPEGAYRILVRGMEVMRCEKEVSKELWSELDSEVRTIVDIYRVDLIDDGATRRALDYVERVIPDLVNGVVPSVASLTQLTGLLRALLREGITTRHLDIVLQTIAEHGSKLTERQILAEVRSSLAPVISASVAEGRIIKGAVVEPVIDLVLGKAEESGSLVSGELVDLICEQVEQLKEEKVVLVISKRARAYLRDVVRVRWASIPVIAHEEIAPRFEFKQLGQIQLTSDEQRHALVQGIL